MITRRFIVVITLIAGLSITGCKHNRTDETAVPVQSSPRLDTVSNVQYAEEAELYESADRVIWQKPELVIQQLGDVEGKVIADLGAGTGYFSRRLAYRGATVIAIDIDPRAVQWMEEQKARFPTELQDRLLIRQATPDDPNLGHDEVDMVLMVNTYSYIDARIPYFTRLKSSLRPGGIILIIDFKKEDTPFGPPMSERVDVAEVERELRTAGYRILKVDEELLNYQYVIKVKRED
jgi:SAM-dependent methyltransferase